MKNIAYVGIDYHLKSLTIAVMIKGQNQLHDVIKMNNEDKPITKYLKKLAKDFEIKACYEASFSGYSFKRKMDAWGYHCDVIAPSLIPKKKGDHRKNDKRDAMELAKLYAGGLLTIVHAPTEYEESVRNLIRCRMAFKDSEKRAKNQINSLLFSQGISYGHNKWNNKHRSWLAKVQMPEKYLQVTLDEYLGHLSYLETRIKALDDQIEEIAKTDIYAPSVIKLRAFRGIGTLTAMLLIAEITDFRRFPDAKALMAFLGLIPSEYTSAEKHRGGAITKAGNSRIRKCLVEAVQHCSKNPRLSQQMKENLSQLDAYSANIAVNCMKRLHKRYWHLILKGKIRSVALTAAAREFTGFMWAMMQPEPANV